MHPEVKVEYLLQLAEGMLRRIDATLFGLPGRTREVRAAIAQVYGEQALVQRCRAHKVRNVTERLPISKVSSSRAERNLASSLRTCSPDSLRCRIARKDSGSHRKISSFADSIRVR
jgi:hypothetical protein